MSEKTALFLLAALFVGALHAAPTIQPDPKKDPKYCGACHQRIYKEWASSRMGKGIHNPIVYQFYTGTNPEGQQDGLGFQPFTHGEKGDCADCHVPELVLDEHAKGHEVDLGVAMKQRQDYGISCNFCHTIAHAEIRRDADGRYDTRLFDSVKRDPQGVIHGPFADAQSPAHPTVADPNLRKAELCGVCHLNQERFLSISTYDDWKKAYAEGKTDKTCQQCHMPLIDKPVLLADAVTDRPKRNGTRAHTFGGAHDPAMLRKALRLDMTPRVDGERLVVETTVENIGAGHKVPGSGPIRNVILKIDAFDADGKPLPYVGGKQGLLPPLAGTGNPKNGRRDANDWAGMPGKMYAKVYESKPIPKMGNRRMVGVGGFAADRLAFDTTLKPREPDSARFVFKLPASGATGVTVKARLVYRDAFKPLSDRKHWKLAQREMASVVKKL